MKVLMLSDFYPPIIGGMEKHVSLLGRELARRGHEVIVCTTGRKDLPKIEYNSGVKVVRFEGLFQKIPFLHADSRRRYPAPIQDFIITEKLKTIIKEERPDVVHSHGWILYSFLPLKKQLGIPLIVTLHSYDFICSRKNLLIDRKICNRPFTIRCVVCGLESYGLTKSFFAYLGVKLNEKKLGLVDKYIAVSSFVKEAYCKHLGLGDKDIVVIPNFHEIEEQNPEVLESQMLPDDFILFVGALTPSKGIDVLLKAYRRLKTETRLVIIGIKGPRVYYERTKNVTIIENAPDNVVNEAYEKCRFTVVPSIFPDPCPTVALEAMSRRKAIIGSDIGGLRDIIKNGESGILVRPNDPRALAKSMTYLLENPSLCSEMGEKGYVRLTNLFSAVKVIPEIENLYESIAKTIR